MGILRSDRVSGLGGANAINGSVHFPNDGATGTGDYLRVDRKDNSDFNLGTNDFTMEFWFNSENVGSTLFPFAFAAPTVAGSSDAGFYIRFNGGVINAYCFEGNNTIGGVSTGSVNEYTWYHVAYVRSGSTFTIYLDGTSAATASSAEAVNYDAGWNFNIGSAYTNVYHYNGFLSNLRIVNGTALYTSNFTVPNRLEAVENTVLLCCQSPGNVLQEASGKTLHLVRTSTNNGPAHTSRFAPDVGEDHGTTFTDNTKFDTLSYMVPPGGTTTQRGRDRGVASQGYSPGDGASGTMTFFNISSGGITQRFGSLVTSSYTHTGGSSSTRGVIAGGYLAAASPVYDVNTIEYVTIATTGNALNFGDRTVIGRTPTAVSSETRVCMAGGGSTYTNIIDFITTSTTGDATNFGDLGNQRTGFSNSMQSTTRGIFAGGYQAPSPHPAVNTLEYITMASAGDATNFGDMTSVGTNSTGGSMSSNTRGVTALGNAPGATNIINYVTIATTGDAADFGDMTTTRKYSASCSSHTRGVIIGGETPTYVNTIEYITIASTGNSLDFGDVGSGLSAASRNAAFSDCHGGLS